jgi:2-amino-4-hydroxy-6-hydroxymethyldihydropteridine diphosphokinase
VKVKESFYLGLGGNQRQTLELFSKVLAGLNSDSDAVVQCSRVYTSAPLPLPNGEIIEQNDFYNLVLELISSRTPTEMLAEVLRIEAQLGRVRDESSIKWGPRPIDIDIIACGNIDLQIEGLSIPHPRMHERLFVLLPMQEIAPDWIHPITQLSLPEMIKDLEGSMPCKIHGPL